MNLRIFSATYERGTALMAAGCPLDYPEFLPRDSAARRKPFRAKQLPGYIESRIYAFEHQTDFVLALRLGTDRPSGTIITGWSFVPPWEEHEINWDYEAEDIIPERHRDVYKRLLKSRLPDVLNERRLLRRGCPLDGLLCGRSFEPVGKAPHNLVSAELSLTDDIGNMVKLSVGLAVIRPAGIPSNKIPASAGRRSDSLQKRAAHGD